MWISIFSILVLIISLMYMLVMVAITAGWFNLDKSWLQTVKAQKQIAVVVAARNEESTIGQLLKSIEQQRYNPLFFEVVIIDDHSDDRTIKVVTEFIREHSGLNIRVMEATGQGKKAAIKQGISSTKSDLIITTDADCILPPNWLQTCVDAFESKDIKLLMAPVIYEKKTGFLQKFFCLEFFSLVASGAGAAAINLPFMGNGANMAFTREAYESGTTSKAYNRYTSGDDVFLIHQTVKKFGRKSVRFLLHHQMLVETPPPDSIKQFLNQRLRWASKAKGYQSPEAILVSLVVLLANSMLVLLFLTGIPNHLKAVHS